MTPLEGDATEVRDCYGRPYRVGESDRGLLRGHSRRWMVGSAWAALLGAGTLQYGYALAALAESGGAGRGRGFPLAVLACWSVCQAAAVPAAERLRSRGLASPAVLVLLGGAGCAGALAVVATAAGGRGVQGGAGVPVMLAYGLMGGVGAGLVYAAGATTAGRWYPERAPAAIAAVTGGYAYGAVPFLLVVGLLGASPATLRAALCAAGGLTLAAACVCGVLLRDPPEHWWPAQVDPRRWALNKHLNRSLRRNHPPVWETAARPGARSGAWRQLYVAAALSSALLLLDLGHLAIAFATRPGLASAAACAAFAAGSGLGRSAVGAVAERVGRRAALATALALSSPAQIGLYTGGPVVAVCCAALTACGTAGWYPVLVGLLRDFYGRHAGQRCCAALYTAKAFGGAVGCALAAPPASAAGAAVAAAVGVAAALAVHRARRPWPGPGLLPIVRG